MRTQEVLVKRIVILLIIVAVAFGVDQYLKKVSSGTAVGEIEQKRGPIGELLEEKEVRDGEVVFYLRKDRDRAPVISADYVNKSFLGWKWAAGGGHTLPAASETETAWSYQYIAATKGSFFNHSPFPLLFGSFSNPKITAVTLKSVQTGQETKAEVILSKENDRLWYAFIPEEQGKSFDLNGFASTGESVSVKHITQVIP
jgi:hypothetical protein